MKNIVINTLPIELVEELQRTQMEVESCTAVVDRFLDRHINDENADCLNSPVFIKYQSELAEKEAKHNILKNRITFEYIPDEYRTERYNWSVDYSTNELSVSCS